MVTFLMLPHPNAGIAGIEGHANFMECWEIELVALYIVESIVSTER